MWQAYMVSLRAMFSRKDFNAAMGTQLFSDNLRKLILTRLLLISIQP